MADSHDLSRRLLLATMHPAAARFDALLLRNHNQVDWSWLINRATKHKVAALLAWRVDQSGISDDLPSTVRARLQAISRAGKRRSAQARRTLEQVAGALDAARVPFLLIKGSLLSELVYGQPMIRPFQDVDIVVHEDAVDAAEAVLERIGYSFIAPEANLLNTSGVQVDLPPGEIVPEPIGRAFYRRHHFHLQLAPPAADRLPVEIHWKLARPEHLSLAEADLWRETQLLSVGGTPVRCLAGEAMIVHAASHAINDGHKTLRLLHLADIAWLLERAPIAWQTDRVWQLARAWAAAGDLSCALALMNQLFDYRHPDLPPPTGARETIRRAALHLVSRATRLVDRDATGDNRLHLIRDGMGEAVWEICSGRSPKRAGLLVADLVQMNVNRLRDWAARRPGRDTRLAAPLSGSEAPTLPEDIQTVVSDMGWPVTRALHLRTDGSADEQSVLLGLESGGNLEGRLVASVEEADRIADLSAHFNDGPFPALHGKRGRALLLEWIDGEPFAYRTRDLDAFRGLGTLLARVHSLSMPPPALVPLRPADDPGDRLRRAMRQLASAGVLAGSVIEQTTRMATAQAPSSAAVGCTYADFSAESVLVDWAGEQYLPDVGRIVAETLDYDLAQISIAWTMTVAERDAFFEGYGRTRSLDTFRTHRFFWTVLARADLELRRLHLGSQPLAPLWSKEATDPILREGAASPSGHQEFRP